MSARRAGRWLRLHAGAVAWVAMIVVVSLLFVRQQRTLYELCTNSNEARAGILGFVETILGPEDDLGPEGQRILELARETFAQKECPPEPWL